MHWFVCNASVLMLTSSFNWVVLKCHFLQSVVYNVYEKLSSSMQLVCMLHFVKINASKWLNCVICLSSLMSVRTRQTNLLRTQIAVKQKMVSLRLNLVKSTEWFLLPFASLFTFERLRNIFLNGADRLNIISCPKDKSPNAATNIRKLLYIVTNLRGYLKWCLKQTSWIDTPMNIAWWIRFRFPLGNDGKVKCLWFHNVYLLLSRLVYTVYSF